jgi:hypothetical protein
MAQSMTTNHGIPKGAAIAIDDLLDHCAKILPGQEVVILAQVDGLYGGDNLVDETAISWIQAAVQHRSAGPKGLPPAIVKKLEDVVDKTLKDRKVIEIIDKLEGILIDFRHGEEYKKEILTDLTAFKPIVADLTAKRR